MCECVSYFKFEATEPRLLSKESKMKLILVCFVHFDKRSLLGDENFIIIYLTQCI